MLLYGSPVIKHFFILDLSICKVLLHSDILEKKVLLFKLSIAIICNFSDTKLLVPLLYLIPFLISYGAGNNKRLFNFNSIFFSTFGIILIKLETIIVSFQRIKYIYLVNQFTIIIII